MKRCPYCGAAYPENVPYCAIDHSPLTPEEGSVPSPLAGALDAIARCRAEQPMTDILLATFVAVLLVAMLGYVSFIRL